MKATTILKFSLMIIPLILFSFALPLQALEQEVPYDRYSRKELAQMLAPIALYPDTLLSQILMASTYPIELIEADRWIKQSPELRDEVLDDVLQDKSWDPSVKALCHFPSILALMSERISETTELGNAFLAQEEEVLDMIQELRATARAQGTLATSSQQKVIVDKDTIIIEPANTRVIYVPYYDPYYVYGSWWYPNYPPYFWGPPGVSFGIGFSYWPGIYFGLSFSNWCYFDWHYHYVYIDVYKRPRYVRHDHWVANPGRWHHSPTHRRGVAYRDQSTARKFGQRPYPLREHRDETRGFPEREGLFRKLSDEVRTRSERAEPSRAPVTAPTAERNRQREQQFEQVKPSQRQVERQRTLHSSTSERERVEKELQRRQRAEREDQERSRIREKQRTMPLEPVRRDREQQRVESQQRIGKQQQIEQHQRVEQPKTLMTEPIRRIREQQKVKPQKRIEQSNQSRQQVREKVQERESVFNRVDEGHNARSASERGRSSRQGRSNEPAKSRGPWGKPGTNN